MIIKLLRIDRTAMPCLGQRLKATKPTGLHPSWDCTPSACPTPGWEGQPVHVLWFPIVPSWSQPRKYLCRWAVGHILYHRLGLCILYSSVNIPYLPGFTTISLWHKSESWTNHHSHKGLSRDIVLMCKGIWISSIAVYSGNSNTLSTLISLKIILICLTLSLH